MKLVRLFISSGRELVSLFINKINSVTVSLVKFPTEVEIDPESWLSDRSSYHRQASFLWKKGLIAPHRLLDAN